MAYHRTSINLGTTLADAMSARGETSAAVRSCLTRYLDIMRDEIKTIRREFSQDQIAFVLTALEAIYAGTIQPYAVHVAIAESCEQRGLPGEQWTHLTYAIYSWPLSRKAALLDMAEAYLRERK